MRHKPCTASDASLRLLQSSKCAELVKTSSTTVTAEGTLISYSPSGLRRHFGHLAARLGALAAHMGATPHHLVAIGQALAIIRATFANIGAHAAGPGVELRTAQHEVCARRADLGAIEQQADMTRFSVLAAHLQTMLCRFKTDCVAVRAVLDALTHVGTDLMWHAVFPFALSRWSLRVLPQSMCQPLAAQTRYPVR